MLRKTVLILSVTEILRWLLVAGMLLCVTANATAAVVNFQDLGAGPNTYSGPGGGNYWNGPAANFTDQPDPWGGTDEVGVFQSGGVSFVNRYDITYGSWSGFAYSDFADQTTPGYANQYQRTRRRPWAAAEITGSPAVTWTAWTPPTPHNSLSSLVLPCPSALASKTPMSPTPPVQPSPCSTATNSPRSSAARRATIPIGSC